MEGYLFCEHVQGRPALDQKVNITNLSNPISLTSAGTLSDILSSHPGSSLCPAGDGQKRQLECWDGQNLCCNASGGFDDTGISQEKI